MKYFVEISLKIKNKKFEDLLKFEFKSIKEINTKKLYCFIGNIEKQKIIYIAKNLLVDPIVEDYKVLTKFKKNPKEIVVNIWYKPQVLDVVALYVLKGIRYLGIKEEIEIHTGSQVCVKPRLKENILKNLIEKNFMNPLIQKYEIV